MAKQGEYRIPKVGDIVGIAERPGTWVVSGISHATKHVNLEKIGINGKKIGVPWNLLTYRDEMDESQNALRVVREATEDR